MNPSSRFDQAAAQWDQNPGRVETARAVGAAVLGAVQPQPGWRVLDYGAGTGLLTLNLRPHVGSLLALDSSTGMAEQLRRKLAAAAIDNVGVQLWDLEARPFSGGGFDLAVSSMTLHHLRDVPLVLHRLAALLKPGGWLAVADLDAEDGTFHAQPEGVFHQGFDRAQIAEWLRAAGLTAVSVANAHSLRKPSSTGELRTYGIFLATGRKGGGPGA